MKPPQKRCPKCSGPTQYVLTRMSTRCRDCGYETTDITAYVPDAAPHNTGRRP